MTTPPAIADHLWQSTIFGIIVSALTFALRRNQARIRYWLWFGASVKLLLPFSLIVGAGSVVALPVSAPVTVAVSSSIGEAAATAAQPFSSAGVSTLVGAASDTFGSRLSAFVMIGWACGFVAILSLRFRSWVSVRRALRSSSALELPAWRGLSVRSSTARLEPGVVGVWRQTLLLPAGIASHLSADQLDAVLAHERAHVRRRDNLTASVHMLVEALFWFHPLVWWIGARLIEERERACDEDVLRLGGDPRVYADAILTVCRFYIESPLACVSGVTGSDLKRRLAAIFGAAAHELTLKTKCLLAVVCGLVTVGPLVIGMGLSAAAAQLPSTGKQFEVVSIRPGPPLGSPFPHFDGGRWSAPRMTAKWLIRLAYGVMSPQIVGAPGWAEDSQYTIEAKLPADAGETDLPAMFQRLLVDRFRLVFHRETRVMRVRTITVAKQGLKLKPASAACSTDPAEDEKPLLKRRRCGEVVESAPPENYQHGVVYQGFSVSMADLARSFNDYNAADYFVDETGLTGLYDLEVRLDYTPPPDMGSNADDRAAFMRAVFKKAWQDQAGLVLDIRQERPVPVFVVDHLERPTPNGPAVLSLPPSIVRGGSEPQRGPK